MYSCSGQIFAFAVIFVSGTTWTTVILASFTENGTTDRPTAQSATEVSTYSQKLVSEWGSNGVIDATQLGQILERLGMYDAYGKEGTEQQHLNVGTQT